jgi:4-amino-4-deoxy-L-arabinose transferase-like glycosyltransferase
VTGVLLLAALYMAVQAVSLLLTQSGDWGLGWTPLSNAPALAVVAAPLVVVAAGASIRGAAPAALGWWRGPIGGWRVACGLLVLTLAGTLGRPAPREYATGLAMTATFASIGLVLLVAIAVTTPAGAAARLADRLAAWRPMLPWIASAWTLCVSVLLGWLVFERVPHVPDEVAYWFQAKYFSAGRLYLPAPPDPAAFELPHTLVDGGRWYGIFPPGWPAVLALGMWLGAPWVVNPLLGAAAILLLHRLAASLYSRRVADITAVIVAASPMFLLMSAGLMSHPLSLVLGLLAVLGWRRGVQEHSPGWALSGGLALGGLVLTRPLEGAVITVVLAAWSAVGLVGRARPRRLAGFLIVAIATGAATLPYNGALTGRFLYDPITKYFDGRYYPGSNRLGFGSDVGNTGWRNDLQPGHSPVEAVLNGQRNGYLLNLELFGWTCGSLAAVAALVLFGRWSRVDAFVASIAAGIVGGLALYWYGGADFGARYWYQLVAPVAMLSARGIESVADRAHAFAPRAVVAGRVAAGLGVASISALLVFLPWRAATKYYHYRGMGGGVADVARAKSFENALVFVRGAGSGTPFSRYSAAAVFNPRVLEGAGPIFARDLGRESRQRIECAFAGRVVRGIDAAALPSGALVIDPDTHAVHACASRATREAVGR